VALVFVAFMALSQFVFHSWTGVKALAIASVGFLVPLAATVTTRIEYRVTEAGLERRPLPRRRPGAFREVFRWDRLSEVVPVRYGIKFALRVDEPRPLQRFWKTHLSDAYSGEIHVEAEDRARVLRILAERGFVPAEPDGSDEPDEPA
jgi:hypothetical protein